MSGPPTDTSAGALFEALVAMPRPFAVRDFPRVDPIGNPVGTVHIQVLTQLERMAAMAEAEKVVRKLLKEEFPRNGDMADGYRDMRSNELAVQMLFRACKKTAKPTEPFFPSVDACRKELTGDEIGVLYNKYLIVQAERGPIVADMDNDDVDLWVKRLVEGASCDPLGVLTLEAHMELTRLLAVRLHSFQTGNGSSGSPAESTSEPSDDDLDLTES